MSLPATARPRPLPPAGFVAEPLPCAGPAPSAARVRWRSACVGAWMAASVALAGAATTTGPSRVEGRVVGVVDHTVLLFEPEGHPPMDPPWRLRLAHVASALPCQPHAAAAREALQRWAQQRPASVSMSAAALAQSRRGDRSEPVAARVTVDGLELGQQLVVEGLAHSPRASGGRGPLMKEERVAVALKRGMHAQGGALHPDDHRRQHGPCPAK